MPGVNGSVNIRTIGHYCGIPLTPVTLPSSDWINKANEEVPQNDGNRGTVRLQVYTACEKCSRQDT